MKLKPESIFCFPHINKLSIRTRRIVQMPFNKFYLNFVEHEDLGIGKEQHRSIIATLQLHQQSI